MERSVTIPGEAPLRGSFFAADLPRAVAVLNGATAVSHHVYGHFARWLSEEQNVSCLTYDYRDFGDSLTGDIRRSTASMADWGIRDTLAARRWAETQAPGLPLWMIGHSLGGLMIGHHPDQDRIARMIAVCSGPVHLSDHPMPQRAAIFAMWHLVGPVVDRSVGYIPGKLSGLGMDMPGSVFRQWRHWCTTPGFDATDPEVPAADTSALTCPLRTVSLTDDTSVPPHVVRKLADRYPHSPATHVVLRPKDFGLKKVGHAAAFSRRNAALWPQIIAEA